MTLPPCPWCLGQRVEDAVRWSLTGWGCSSCGTALGLQIEPIPPTSSDWTKGGSVAIAAGPAFIEHPLTGALDGAGVDT